MKKMHLIIPLFVPVASVAQFSVKASSPHWLSQLAKIDSIKTDQGAYAPLIRNENASTGKVIELNGHPYLPLSASSKATPPIGSAKSSPVDLALTNLVLLEKINALTRQCKKLEQENQQRSATVRQQQAVTIQLQEEIKQLKSMLQQ